MFFQKLQKELLVGSLDVETSMAYVSAIREIADGEQLEGFDFSRHAYEGLAQAIAKMAEGVDGGFASAYRLVAERVHAYARSLQ